MRSSKGNGVIFCELVFPEGVAFFSEEYKRSSIGREPRLERASLSLMREGRARTFGSIFSSIGKELSYARNSLRGSQRGMRSSKGSGAIFFPEGQNRGCLF